LAGPVQTEQGYHLLLPEKFIPAQLTDEVRKELFERLFQEWLKGELTYWNCQ
jgi:parvulin-like peptidyl-prolyl isomerase